MAKYNNEIMEIAYSIIDDKLTSNIIVLKQIHNAPEKELTVLRLKEENISLADAMLLFKSKDGCW